MDLLVLAIRGGIRSETTDFEDMVENQYFNFGQDIKALADTLQGLPHIGQNAENQRQS